MNWTTNYFVIQKIATHENITNEHHINQTKVSVTVIV